MQRHYAHAASQLAESIRDSTGLVIGDFVVTTDETDPQWL